MYFLSRWDTRRDLNEFTLDRMGDEFDVATNLEGILCPSSRYLAGGATGGIVGWHSKR